MQNLDQKWRRLRLRSLLHAVLLAAVCILLNLGLARLITLLQLPLFLDSVGTVLAAARRLPPAQTPYVGTVPVDQAVEFVVSVVSRWHSLRKSLYTYYYNMFFAKLLPRGCDFNII